MKKVIIFPLCMFLVFSFVLASCSPVENTSKKNTDNTYSDIFSFAQTQRTTPPQSTKSTDTASFIDTASTDYNTTKAGDNSTQNSNSSSKNSTNNSTDKNNNKTNSSSKSASSSEKISTTKNTTKSTSNTTTEKPQQNDGKYQAVNYSTVKGIWFSYIELYPKLKDKATFENYIKTAFDNVKIDGYNTVFVHVRAFGDALYPSDYFALAGTRAKTLTGSRNFDPLQIMVNEAHKRNLSIHAWINPYRIANYSSVKGSFTLKNWWNDSYTKKHYIKEAYNESGSFLWYVLNPAIDEVVELITNGVKEIVENYNVDGIHMDDYFYPSSLKDNDTSFDYEQFKNSGYSDIRKFRISNTTKLVKNINKAIKSINSSVKFGIAPTGNNYQYKSSGIPWNDYIDSKAWINNKYIDYIAPQIYWSFNNKSLPFETAFNGWANLTKGSSVKLVIGITLSAPNSSSFKSEQDVLKRQAQMALNQANGLIIYKYAELYGSSDFYVNEEIQAMKPIIKG